MNNGFLYATVLRYPEDGDVVIESLREADVSHLPLFHGIIRDVDVLGFDEKLVFSRDDKGLHVRTASVQSEYPVVLRIAMD